MTTHVSDSLSSFDALSDFLSEHTISFSSYAEYREAVAVAEDFAALLLGTGWEQKPGIVRMQIPLCRVKYSSKQELDIGGLVFGGLEAFIVSQHLVEKAISQIARKLGVRFSFHLSVYGGKWKASIVLDGGTTGAAQSPLSSLALMKAMIVAAEALQNRGEEPATNETAKEQVHDHIHA